MAKILIVEDDPLIARTLHKRLEGSGYKVVHCATTGEEALADAAIMQPNLVLMDMSLAGSMDGIATAMELRKRYNIPTVYLTANDTPETLKRAKPTRPLGYLIKPYVKEDLYRAVELALYNHEVEMALQQRESQYRYLSNATKLLLSSLSPAAVIQRLADFSLPRLGDFCLFEAVTSDGGELCRVAASHINPSEKEKLQKKLPNISLNAKNYPAVKALGNDKPIFEPAPHMRGQQFKELQCTSFICLPLIADDKKLGALTLGYSVSERHHALEDLELGVELARRATIALEHAQLYQKSLDQIAALTQSEETIQNMNRTLESRVQERTQELQKATQLIQGSLQEKEVLLKEVHHRVKNNLQVISSLLRMQSQTVSDSNTTEILEESQNRIRSMAMIHELLYQSKDLNHINFKTYLDTLLMHLFKCYSGPQRGLSFSIEADKLDITLDAAIPCGLITTELVSNALKHAFPQNRRGTLKVTFQQQPPNDIALIIEDDGVGLPSAIDWENSDSLGFTIVLALCRQMKGVLHPVSKPGDGTRFIFTFPLKAIERQSVLATESNI